MHNWLTKEQEWHETFDPTPILTDPSGQARIH